MSPKKQNINDFLSEEKESEGTLLATIKAVNETEIEITPWNNSGYNFANSLTVEKDAIEYVEKIGETHFCCGTTHQVVKIKFKKDASLPIEKVFEQMHSHSLKTSHSQMEHDIFEDAAMDTYSGNTLLTNGLYNPVPCNPSYQIAQKRCFYVNPYSGKTEFKGMSYLMVYTTPHGKICKMEWTPCR